MRLEQRKVYLDDEHPGTFELMHVDVYDEDSTYGSVFDAGGVHALPHQERSTRRIPVRRVHYLSDEAWERKNSRIYNR